MTWIHIRTEHPKARKDYPCDAFPFLDYDLPAFKELMTDEEVAILDKAIADGCKIKKGEIYVKYIGTYAGEICENKCRNDIDKLCVKYDAYVSD